jgi:hypothetical protein
MRLQDKCFTDELQLKSWSLDCTNAPLIEDASFFQTGKMQSEFRG